MAKIIDQNYLRQDQYRNSDNLDARIYVHKHFSTNTYGWYRWYFDRLNLPDRANILELGCGPGYLWRDMIDRVQAGWTITLSDFSAGMIDQAKENLKNLNRSFKYEVIDAQSIPYEDTQFDAVIANHMLYHVPDRSRALQEIKRVLKPSGTFYCATNGHVHLKELHELMRRFGNGLDFGWGKTSAELFALEDRSELEPYFSNVTVQHYPDELIVTEVEPLVNYIYSMSKLDSLPIERRAELTHFIENEMAKNGSIRISKDSGLFIANA